MVKVLVLSLFFLLMFQGCGENSYDGVHGLKSVSSSSSSVDEALESIYAQIKSDANETYQKSLELESFIDDANSSLQNFSQLQEKSQELILLYKKVEALYIAQKLDDSMIDVPAYVEAFSAGDSDRKEPILEELETIFNHNESVSIENALYKNAYKSLTGLIYALYGDKESKEEIFAKLDARRLGALDMMASKITQNLGQINDFYQNDSTFTKESEESVTILLNQLATSANRLKEWRIGDPGGFTQKYLDKANAKRFEYYASQTSLEAIESILLAHQSMLENGLEEIANEGGAKSEAEALKRRLQTLFEVVDSFEDSIEEDILSSQVKTLYDEAYALQNDYTALINALNFTQDIIEADGD